MRSPGPIVEQGGRDVASHGGSVLSPRVGSAVIAAAVLVLLALSIWRSYSLGQHERMYDNPIYRWRESLAIALSRMQTPPLHGYLAYRSIRDYLAEQGLALTPGEAKTMPTPEQRSALTQDGSRLNQLLQNASRVPIDPSLKPVILTANELGLADYFYWAFRLFGLELNSLVLLYYSILFVSVVAFFVTFVRSRFCLLLLMLYLSAHYFAVGYADTPWIQTIHNSRFLPTLSLLPAMHLALLLLRREPARLITVIAAAVQTVILFFIVFCRNQAFWQVLAILVTAAFMMPFRTLWNALPRPRLWPGTVVRSIRMVWPALLVICGLIGLSAYTARAPDPAFYGDESKVHVFWHTFYAGMVTVDPELMTRYGYGLKQNADEIGGLAVLHDLRGRNEAPPGLAAVVDGVITITVLNNTAEYDQILRRVSLEIMREHPWLVLKSFVIGKPLAQMEMFWQVRPLWAPSFYAGTVLMALASTLIALLAGAPGPRREHIRHAVVAVVPIVICSSMTTFMFPSVLIVDVVTFYLLLLLLGLIYVPLGWAWQRLAVNGSSAMAAASANDVTGPTGREAIPGARREASTP